LRKDRDMNYPRTVCIALTAALLCAGAGPGVRAQISVQPPTGSGGTVSIAPPTASAPAATQTQPALGADTRPSASSILQQMLNSGTALGTGETNLIVPPGPAPGANGLLREGQEMDLRAGHLKRDDNGHMTFVFDAKESPEYPPMGVIPSRRLAAMEDAAGFAPGRTPIDMIFRIAAEVTEYRGKNYLYIKPSAIPVPPPPAPAPATLPAAAPLINAAAPHAPAAALLTEPGVISNRLGRLVRDAKTGVKLIAFDADGKRMADPPMGVIPCKFLTVMEDMSEDGNKPLKFKVSGEVTTYRGKNYLYLKSVEVVTDFNHGIGAGANIGG
jgi:hypothetical protein